MTKLFLRNQLGVISLLGALQATKEQTHLHDLIKANPAILTGDEIAPDHPVRWLLIGSQVPIPDPESGQDRWAIDLLLGDQFARPALVECKRAGNAEIRREVIGQAIEYAANAQHYWSAEAVKRIATVSHSNEHALSEAMDQLAWPDDVDAYFEAFERNLKKGDFRLIFAVDRAPHRLRSTVEFLNREFEHIEALVVEVRRHTVGDETVIASGVLGYSEALRAAKRDAAERRDGRRHDAESFISMLGTSPLAPLPQAARQLLDAARGSGWTLRFSPHGSLLVGLPSLEERTTIAIIPKKGGLLEWYPREFDERNPAAAAALRELASAVGCSSATGYPRTAPEVWITKVDFIVAGLRTIDIKASDALP